jgi:hypothetical protein
MEAIRGCPVTNWRRVAGAEQLIHVGVAALDVAVDDADRLAAQDGPAAVAGLAGGRGYRNFLRHDAQRRVAVLTGTRYEDNGRFVIRRVVRGGRTAHSKDISKRGALFLIMWK